MATALRTFAVLARMESVAAHWFEGVKGNATPPEVAQIRTSGHL
jgi:hypothetical protein